MPANIESDPMFVLLTDALRAGPGSPQWQSAVDALRHEGVDGADERRLLLDAREHLEEGRDYRSVRAGVGFTRKLMSEIEGDGKPAGRPFPTSTIIAVLSALLILVAAGILIMRLAPHDGGGQQAINDLDNFSHRFFDTMTSAVFSDAMPDGWQAIGSLPVDFAGALRPGASKEAKNVGGGARWNATIPGQQAFAMDVAVNAPAPSAALLLEAFVTTDGAFSPDKGTSSRDLVWQLSGRDQHVLLSGTFVPLQNSPAFSSGDTVRILVDKSVAIVDVISAATGKSQRLWAGPHDLGAGPRYVGVRFLQTGPADNAQISVKQVKVTTAGQ